MAWKSCSEATKKSDSDVSLTKLALDWSNPDTWPERGSIDVVLASDVLYDQEAATHVNKLIAHLLGDEFEDESQVGRALVVDPANRPNRDVFAEEAINVGLTAEMVPFPGQEEEFVLINVTPTVHVLASKISDRIRKKSDNLLGTSRCLQPQLTTNPTYVTALNRFDSYA